MLSPQVTVQVIPTSEITNELQTEVYAAAGTQLLRLRDSLEDSELPVSRPFSAYLRALG